MRKDTIIATNKRKGKWFFVLRQIYARKRGKIAGFKLSHMLICDARAKYRNNALGNPQTMPLLIDQVIVEDKNSVFDFVRKHKCQQFLKWIRKITHDEKKYICITFCRKKKSR